MFAAAVPAFAGIAFGVFISERGALRFHHGGAGEIFAGDQLDVFLLALFFVPQHLVHIGVHHFHAMIGLQFFNAPHMAAALELRAEE